MKIALIAEGSSDRMLLPFLSWLLRSIDPDRSYEIVPIDLRDVRDAPNTIEGKIAWLEASERRWDLVLVHRDSDSRDPEPRYREIDRAARVAVASIPVVAVVPVRATETWLLFDERAIRQAAGAPNSTVELGLPSAGEIEKRARPKKLLHDALTVASETRGRRRAKFRPEPRCHTVATAVRDWSPLMKLSACQRLKLDLATALGGTDRDVLVPQRRGSRGGGDADD